MLTPKRASGLSTPQSAKVTRSQSLKSKNELFGAAVSASGGVSVSGAPLGRISLTMNSMYNDSILESYKSPLPIRVNELIFQIKSQDSSQLNANILPNGYVSLVNERRAFIWKLKKSLKNVQCNELTLPHSKSAVRPNCISIEAQTNSKDCVGLCVTNEGAVRYWPSIANEYMCVDAKFELAAGDEAAQLVFLSDDSYLVVTGNGNLWSIEIECEDGKVNPVCRQIDTSSGFISSVSRRMTSLIFGGGSGSLIKNGQSMKSCVRYKQNNELYILIEKNLQKWRINSDNTLTMLWQTNLEKLFYEAYLQQNENSVRINIIFQDCSITKHSVCVLAVVEDDGPRFVIGEIETSVRGPNETTPVNKLKSFTVLNYEPKTDSTAQYRLHAMDNQHAFYICNSNSVVSFTGPSLELAGESQFNTLGDKLIASSHVDGDLVFFSVNHGILRSKDTSVRLSIEEENFGLGNQSLDNNMSFGATYRGLQDISMNMSAGEDVSFSVRAARQAFDFTFNNLATPDQLVFGTLKDAFQFYLKKEERQSQTLIDEIFKTIANDPKKLDLICVELSEKMIDDVPAHDPRWAELNSKSSKSMNTNLIIGNQLRGKIRLHEYYLIFLRKLGLWEKLSSVFYNGREIRTVLALQEHGEKLQLALTIREQLYSKNSEFINMAIEHITKNREEPNSKLIYPHDLFYRRVSKIDDIFNALYIIENDVIKVNSNEQAINYINDTCFFYVKLMRTSQTYREEKSRLYECQGSPLDGDVETIRWTFLPINEVINVTPSIINLCVKQHKLSSEYGLANCNTLENKASILQNLHELDSLIFDEYELRLRSLEVSETEHSNLRVNYDSLKTRLIEVFLKNKQIETAMKLAERYVDFSTLVSICELKSDSELLASYLDKFTNKKFAEFVVKYFMERKRLNFLLKNQFLKRADISNCLDKYKYLSWIKDFKNDNYRKASETLIELGQGENESFMKQKSLLSLGKLSLLAENRFVPDLDSRLNEIDRKLDYLQYIESQAGYISDNTGVLLDQIPYYGPERLIDIYISNPEASEIEFKKAFELIDYLNEDQSKFYSEAQIAHLKTEILVRAVLSDNWEKLYDLDYPESSLRETKFFKSLCLIKESGENIDELIESRNDMLSHELLGHLAKNRKFEYLLQACFEIIQSC